MPPQEDVTLRTDLNNDDIDDSQNNNNNSNNDNMLFCKNDAIHVSHRSMAVESFKVMDILQRANELQAAGHSVIHCEVGQPETGAPEPVAQAAVKALTEPPQVMGYTDAFGLLALREKISQHYGNYYYKDMMIEPPTTDRIVVTTGSSGAFLLVFTACFDAGDVVAIASSGYPCYRNILAALGCQFANIPINAEFKLTAKELKQEIQRRASANEKPIRGLILSSPSNPTGSMLSPSELQELCELTDEHGIQFISDEIYHGISYGKEEATALQYSEKAIVINSFSKYYSMSGWRLGWMIVPTGLIPAINSLQQNMFINAPTISQTAALKCWDEDTLAIYQQHVEKYKASRAILLDELSKLSPPIPPQNIAPADGGFYIYIDLGNEYIAPGYGSVAMCNAFLEEKHVAMTPGIDFEDPSTVLGDRRFRISYSQGVNVATEAMARFHDFWPTWIERVNEAKK